MLGQMKGGVITENDKLMAMEIKEEYEANQKLMESMEKTFTQKLEEAKKQEKIGDSYDPKLPHLVVVNEDPQLSHKLKYSLKDLPVYVGRKQGNPKPKIILSGYGIKVNHAKFYEDKGIHLAPTDPQACEHIFINGKPISTNGVLLKHLDNIILGSTYLLYLEQSGDEYKVDYEMIYDQQQEELEKQNLIKEQDKERQRQAELEQMKSKMEEKFLLEKKQMEENLKKQLEKYEIELKTVNDFKERSQLEKKKKSIQHILDDEEMVKTIQQRLANLENNIFIRQNNKEFIHNSEKFENNLLVLAKKIIKARNMIKKMNRNYHIDLLLSRSIDDVYLKSNEFSSKDEKTHVMFRVENYEQGEVYYWTIDNFNNRYSMLSELYEENESLFDEGKDVNLAIEDDPLWDVSKQSLIGYSFISLKHCLFRCPIDNTTPVFSLLNAHQNASLQYKIEFVDDSGKPCQQMDSSFNIQEGKIVIMKVTIMSIKDMNDLYCKNVSLEYIIFGEMNKTCLNSTNIIERTAIFNTTNTHTFHITNLKNYNYLNEECMIIKIFAVEQVQKLGKLTRKIKLPIENISNSVYLQEKIEIRDRSKTTKASDGKKIEKDKEDKGCILF